METVWIHTPSVGEFRTVKPLLERFPEDLKLVHSFSSPRGEEFFKKNLSQQTVYKLFPPLGFKVKKLLKEQKPDYLLLVESDRYPALLGAKVERKFLINARLSDRSYRLIKFLKPLFVPKLNTFEAILCKDSETCEKFRSLGVKSSILHPCGNLKVVMKPPEGEPNITFPKEVKLFVAGSTHEGEERIVLSAFRKIKERFPKAVLVIAPRHISRSGKVLSLARELLPDAKTLLRSRVKGTFEGDILIVDTLGELLQFYKLADIAFVGGSLVKVGGHNILEPAYFGKPTLYGPFIFKFKDLEKVLKSLGLAFPVRDERELFQKAVEILENPPKAEGNLTLLSKEVLSCYLKRLPFLSTVKW